MRLLIVTSQFPIAGEPNRGRPVYQTIRELSRLATVRVVSPVATYPRWAQPRSYLFRASDDTQTVEGCDVQYVRYPALPAVTRPLNGWSCARALHAPLKAFAPDLVLSYWLYPDAYGAMQAARRAGLPLVAGARGSDLRVRDAVSRALTRPVVNAAQRLLVVSEDLGRVAAENYGADPARIRTIPNGCDASLFHPADRAASRTLLGIAADAEVVTYVGRLVPEKGLRELLDACRTLAAARPRLRLVLVGEGPMREEIATRLAADPSLQVTLAGAQPPAEVARWMAASDLVTLPSYSEGHPNVLVEALACGRPVVATPVGGIPEVVDADSGILVPARDAGALAAGLAQALDRHWDESALARKFSRDWRQVAEDTLEACEQALHESRTPFAISAAHGS
ncbi:glycosyltransferase [Pseudoxanthomonas sacheonensis]|uniref:glycosyltransferase n=1 Tax=Pseudoxanthomonas sacheonensis TaxID=443615 RepID=UPI0013D535B5|nr:glycosyltransferase [Pseudoxanthomonas sacheonensis]KAF1707362.1 glycosyl transferase family 1 [Pseudoxanthomonas sacheonensis]